MSKRYPRSRSRSVAVATALAALLVAAPAVAGTEDDPEIEGSCSAAGGFDIRLAPEYEICAAWFATILGENDGENLVVAGLRTTIELGGSYETRRLPGYVSVGWQRDGCREAWAYSDRVGSDPTLTLFRRCGDGVLEEFDLDPTAATVSADRLTVELSAAELRGTGWALASGAVLGRPVAAASPSLSLAGSLVVEATAGGSTAGPGRDYVVGSD